MGEPPGLGAGAAALLGAGALAAAVAACATSSFHRHVEAERYEAALEAFEADSSLHQEEDALYRAGVLYATPGSPGYDPARGLETLERLLRIHPATPHRREADRLLALLAEVDSLHRRVTELRDQLQQLKAVDLEASPADSAAPVPR